jgi:outer membrane receptor protein involved in Fe transport
MRVAMVCTLLATSWSSVIAQETTPRLPETWVRGETDTETRFEGLGLGSGGLRSSRSAWDDSRHTSVIDSAALRRRQPLDMVQAVEREVGVLMQQTGRGQASPFLRGLTGSQTVLLVDGIRLNNGIFRLGPNQYFNTIDPGQVDHIEVIRGPQSVLWGSDALGGVLNVVTRRADRVLDGSLDGRAWALAQRFRSADFASYSRLSFESTAGAGGVWGGASYLNVNDLDRGGSLGRQPLTGYSQYAGDIRYDVALGDDQILTVALVHLEQMNVPRSDKFPKERRLFDPQQRNLAYIRWQGVLDDNFFDAFVVTLSYQRTKEGTLKREPPSSLIEDRSEFDVDTLGASIVLVRDLGTFGSLTVGGDGYHDDVDAIKNRFDLVGGTSTPRTPQFPPDSYYSRLGTFAEWEWPLLDRVTLLGGIRYSYIEAGATVAMFDPADPGFPGSPPVDTPISPSFQDVTGSGGVVIELAPEWRLTGNISEGFRAPLLDELTSFSDNVNEGVDLPTTGLSPEHALSHDIGLRCDTGAYQAQVSYYWMVIDGLIERELVATDPIAGVDYFQRRNVVRAEIDGVELSAAVDVDDEWTAYGNFWYTLGRNRTDSEPMSRIPPTQGVVGLRWIQSVSLEGSERGDWLDINLWLSRRQDRLSARDIRDSRIPAGGTPGFGVISARYGWQLSSNQSLILGVDNLVDRPYRVHGSGVDGSGISATVGYELRR